MLDFDTFLQVEMRVGKVLRAEMFPEARKPALKIWVDFGPELGIKKTSAQITDTYSPEDLPGRLVIGVINFPPRQIGKFISEFLVLGAADVHGAIVLLTPDKDVPLGGRIH
ncbi:MAG: tRNA-binding protein [Rhodobacteraceae bacterium]|nr:tRNA-binding protein [Paracoccaceae bacterium]